MAKFPEFVLLKQTSSSNRHTQKSKLISAANGVGWGRGAAGDEKLTARYKFPPILVLPVNLHLWDRFSI